jgi:hypothetical protein
MSLKRVSAVLILVLLTTIATSAQRRGPRGRAYTRAEVNELIKTSEDRSDRFVKLFDKAIDKSALDGTEREDQINQRCKDLEKAMDKLRSEFDRKESYLETKPEMTAVLRVATDINAVMIRRRLRADAESEWLLLRRQLNILASVYYLPLLRN